MILCFNSAVSETYTHEELFSMSLQELMDVEVEVMTAGKTPEKIAEIPASVVLIEREDIERYGYTTVEEILSYIPGLYPTNDYSWDGVNFGVRGFWSGVVGRNIILLVNGINQVDDYQANSPITQVNVPVEAIDRIEVIRGPMSVMYGAGAFFGVINIITNNADNNYYKGIVDVSAGSQGTKKTIAGIRGKSEKYEFVVNASLRSTNGIDQPLSDMMTIPPSTYGLADNRTTKGTLEENKKYFNFSGRSEKVFVDLSYNETIKEQYLQGPSISTGGPISLQRTNIAFGYETKITDKTRFTCKFTYQNLYYTVLYDIIMKDLDLEQSIGVKAFETEANLFFQLNPKMNLISGVYFRSATDVNNNFVSTSLGLADFSLLHTKLSLSDDSAINLKAIYSQLNYSPLKQFKVIIGARLEQMPRYNFVQELAAPEPFSPKQITKASYAYDTWKMIPRVAALYKINENHVVKLLYGEAINRPSFQQNVDKFLGVQKDLQPERIQTYEFNYIGSPIHGVTAGFNIFRNELNDLLVRYHSLSGDSYISYFSNLGKMVTNGIELTIKIKPTDCILIDMSGTYQDTKDLNHEAIDVAMSPQWLGYAKLSYQKNNLIVSTTARYVDSMKAYFDTNPTVMARIGDNTQGYINLGANVRLNNFFHKGIYLNLHCSNLLDENIYYPTFTNNAWATKGTLDMSRSFLVTIGYKK